MKKELFAAFILIILFALSLINAFIISDIADDIISLAEKAGQACLDSEWESAEVLTNRAITLWRSRDSYTHIVLMHKDIDAIDDALLELLDGALSEDGASGYISSLMVSERLDELRGTEIIGWGSVF